MSGGRVALEDLVEAYLSRTRTGSAPDIYTFAAQYPKFRARLEALLPLVLQMEGCARETRPQMTAEWETFPELETTDYSFVRKIGSGGMGVVYEALQHSLNRKVALKVLSAAALADPQYRTRLEHEARVIAMLHHPHIVKIFSADCSSKQCYYAMELIDGKGVNHCTFDDLRTVATIGLQTAQALAYAHSCNVLHRDIKPANLLLDGKGDVHVSDFGLAFTLQTPSGRKEDPSNLHGTLRYMAPERLAHGLNTFAGDQYSFGVTLYEMVTHRPILPDHSTKTLVARITQGPLPPLSCAEPDLAAIINKCIAFRPEDRYPSMDAVVADLQRFLNHNVVSAASTSAWRRFRLWVKRKPAIAALSFLGMGLFVAFLTALGIGYVRVNAARQLAEQNAAHANATLEDIFYHIDRQTPTTGGTELLARLMPYYQAIAQQQKLSPERLAHANQIVGTAAMRSGKYAIAEEAFRSLVAHAPTPAALYQLGEALRLQEKTEEATAIFRQLAEEHPTSTEAIVALQALERYAEAYALLQARLKEDADDPDLRFLYAQLLARTPPPEGRPTVNAQAIPLLNELVEEVPDRPEYGIALMETMTRKLRQTQRLTDEERSELKLALAASYPLLGRFPNTPGVLDSVVDLHRAYIRHLHRDRKMPTAQKEIERLQGMLEILSHNPEVSADVKELLHALQTETLPPPRPPRGRKPPHPRLPRLSRE